MGTRGVGNAFADIPEDLEHEVFEHLAGNDRVRIERIVSRGHRTPESDWYDQECEEWVILLRGAARLRFEDGRIVALSDGDHIHIPVHCRHKVEWTAPGVETIWLAVHY